MDKLIKKENKQKKMPLAGLHGKGRGSIKDKHSFIKKELQEAHMHMKKHGG